MDEDLAGLDPADRHLPPALHAAEVVLGHISLPELGGEQVGGGDRVLHREVDADAAGRGHGVRGVADAEQARPVPVGGGGSPARSAA